MCHVRKLKLISPIFLVAALGCSSPAGVAPRRDARLSTLRFEGGAILTAHPSQLLHLAISSGSGERIRVWMEGAYGDASLSADELIAELGRAEFTLTAPSTVTDFRIHAVAPGSVDTILSVHMTSGNTATVTVTAAYAGGRSTEPVVASIVSNGDCTDANAISTTSLRRVATGFVNEKITIANIPAGEALAISARIGHYAVGCTVVKPLAAGSRNEISISLHDVPVSLGATSFNVTFGIDESNAADAAAWSRALDDAIATTLTALLRGTTDEAKALLDEMRIVAPTDGARAEFEATRNRDGWDATATTWIKKLPYPIWRVAMMWMTSGKAQTSGPLRGVISTGPDNASAEFSVRGFGRLTAADVLVTQVVPARLVVGANDYVQITTTVAFNANALVVTAASLEAAREPPHLQSGGEALANYIDCSKFATALVGTGVSYSACDSACTADLCRKAFNSLWEGARASTTPPNLLQVAIRADVRLEIDDSARATAFRGLWVADVTSSSGPFALRGPLQAKTIEP